MSNELAKKEMHPVSTTPEGAWEDEAPIRSEDILLPRLHLLQAVSKLVADGKAQMGDIVSTVTGKILGGRGKPVECIFIKRMPTVWQGVEPASGRLVSEELVTAQNANRDFMGVDAYGNPVKFYMAYKFFALLPSDLSGMVYEITFKSTSQRIGKQINSYFFECQGAKKSPARYVLMLSSRQEKNNKGQPYYVWELGHERRETTAEEFDRAYTWHKTLKQASVKVDAGVPDDFEVGSTSFNPENF